MKITSTSGLEDRRFTREIELFLSITGRKRWDGLFEKIERVPGIFYKDFLFAKNPLIATVNDYNQLNKKGMSIWKKRSSSLDYLALTAYVFNRITKNINEKARNELIAKIIDDDNRSLLFELSIATHFLRHSYDVQFFEYERSKSEGRAFDFFVSKYPFEAEIECKWKSYDTGRRLKRSFFYLFCDEIHKQFEKSSSSLLIEIEIKDLVSQDTSKLKEIASAIRLNSKNGQLSFWHDGISVRISPLPNRPLANSPKNLAELIAPFQTPNSHFAALPKSNKNLIIKMQCEDTAKILDAIHDELKKSRSQFSRIRPGLIACYLEGILPEEWQELIGDTGIARMTSDLLNREGTKHVHTISYSSDSQVFVSPNLIEYGAPMLFFRNPNCAFHRNEDIFCLRRNW